MIKIIKIQFLLKLNKFNKNKINNFKMSEDEQVYNAEISDNDNVVVDENIIEEEVLELNNPAQNNNQNNRNRNRNRNQNRQNRHNRNELTTTFKKFLPQKIRKDAVCLLWRSKDTSFIAITDFILLFLVI